MRVVPGISCALVVALAAVAACSSTTTGDGSGDAGASTSTSSSGGTSGTTSSSGTSGTTSSSGSTGTTSGGVDAGFDGGFDFTFTGGGTDIQQAVFQVAPVYGSFCMGSPKVCSFTGSVTIGSTGCSLLLNVGFVSTSLTAGTVFPVVVDSTTPPEKSTVSYTEVCGATTKMWKGTGGTVTLDVLTPPAQGFATGTLSFSVQNATMAVAPSGGGAATGSFTVSGKARDVSFTSTD